MRERERESSTKSQDGLYNMPQNPTLPPKSPRSGVTFQNDRQNVGQKNYKDKLKQMQIKSQHKKK